MEKMPLSPRFRGEHALRRYPNGEERYPSPNLNLNPIPNLNASPSLNLNPTPTLTLTLTLILTPYPHPKWLIIGLHLCPYSIC
jgi:hypothetical protein